MKFCICNSRVVNNIVPKFHYRNTCRKWEMKPYNYILLTNQIFRTKSYYSLSALSNGRCIKISATGVEQKPNYNCWKFSEPFTKLQLCSVKGSEYFQTLYLTFCLTPSIQILTKFLNFANKTFGPKITDDPLPSICKLQDHYKVSCFHISSCLKKECKQVLVKKFSE